LVKLDAPTKTTSVIANTNQANKTINTPGTTTATTDAATKTTTTVVTETITTNTYTPILQVTAPASVAIEANNTAFNNDVYAVKTLNNSLNSYLNLSFGQAGYSTLFNNLYTTNNLYSTAVPSTINGNVQSSSNLYP
jgi:hypothetical protein